MKLLKRIIFIALICFSAASALLLGKIFFFPSENFCTHTELKTEVVPPTCTLQGYTVYSCVSCSYFAHSDFSSPIPHDLERTHIEATCTNAGFTAVRCKGCSFAYNEEYTNPKNHSIKSKTVEPNCENAGYTEYFCVNCSFLYTADEINANTHNYISVITAPTCTEEGFTTLSCAQCDSKIYTEYKKPLGHDYYDEKIYVTSTSDGYTLTTCSRCELNEKSQAIYSSDVYEGARSADGRVLAYGIDVSKHNGVLSWSVLKEDGVEFAILRAANNTTLDQSFEYNYANAKANGIDVGAYVYVNAKSVNEIYSIIDKLLPILDGKKFEYPIFFDMEEDSLSYLGKDLLTEMCVAFITEMQSHGYFAALYTNENWLKNYYDTQTVSKMFDVWYARYPIGASDAEWDHGKYGDNVGMWQYSQEGKLKGHDCVFDLNYAYKDYPKIMKRFHLNGY